MKKIIVVLTVLTVMIGFGQLFAKNPQTKVKKNIFLTGSEALNLKVEVYQKRFKKEGKKDLKRFHATLRQIFELTKDQNKIENSNFITERSKKRRLQKISIDLKLLNRDKIALLMAIQNRLNGYVEEQIYLKKRTISQLSGTDRILSKIAAKKDLTAMVNGFLAVVDNNNSNLPLKMRKEILNNLEERLISNLEKELSAIKRPKKRIVKKKVIKSIIIKKDTTVQDSLKTMPVDSLTQQKDSTILPNKTNIKDTYSMVKNSKAVEKNKNKVKNEPKINSVAKDSVVLDSAKNVQPLIKGKKKIISQESKTTKKDVKK